MNKCFIQWWIIFLTFALTMFWLTYQGATMNVFMEDFTYITSITFAFFLISSMAIGFASYRISDQNYHHYEPAVEFGWYAGGTCMSLGILGTAVGSCILLRTTLSNIDVNSSQAITGTIAKAATNLGVALTTTAVGIGSYIFLSLMTYNLQHTIDMWDKDKDHA